MKRGKAEGRATDEMRSEYDARSLKGGVRGKYLRRYNSGTNLVRLDADVSKAFPDERSVNEALRVVLSAARNVGKKRTA